MTELETRRTNLAATVKNWRKSGARVALVPTMGALHAGHLALVSAARARADKVIVSIFVNPTQFAPHEDFSRYPRDLAGDQAKLETTGDVDLIYAPHSDEMYLNDAATTITVGGPATGLESQFRPHFFSGVATVVTKLFVQCAPNIAVFGEKDYQQLLVVRRLTMDLDLDIEIVGVPTLRETDGLAMSSRNAYLSLEQRSIAGHLNHILRKAGARAKSGVSVPQAEAEGQASLVEAGFDRIDYVAIRDAKTLRPVPHVGVSARVLAAAHIGGVRLIDNQSI